MDIRAGEKCKTSKRNWQAIKFIFKSTCLVRCIDRYFKGGVEKDGGNVEQGNKLVQAVSRSRLSLIISLRPFCRNAVSRPFSVGIGCNAVYVCVCVCVCV